MLYLKYTILLVIKRNFSLKTQLKTSVKIVEWRDAGVVELAALEKRYAARYPGFESPSLRQVIMR
jgi:hypothetical protein